MTNNRFTLINEKSQIYFDTMDNKFYEIDIEGVSLESKPELEELVKADPKRFEGFEIVDNYPY